MFGESRALEAKRLMASKRYDPPLFRDADGDQAPSAPSRFSQNPRRQSGLVWLGEGEKMVNMGEKWF